jgi:O-antigen/teichoic acid export membrane protein
MMAENVVLSSGLTSGRTLARNTIFNLIGQIAPMLVAVFAIPVLIRVLGTDRFGILTLAWLLVGYFSLFDLGIGRALTQLVAKKLVHESDEIPALVVNSLLLMLVISLVGTVLIVVTAPWLVGRLKVSPELQTETLQTFYLLAATLPVVVTTSGLRGVLEAQQLFGQLNIVRIFLGVFTYLGPLLALLISHSLLVVTAVMVGFRLIAWMAYLFLCLRSLPGVGNGLRPDWSLIRPLLSFGGWMTVSNVFGPLMVYLDRFLIGGLVSATAVAYYATPFEMATKLWFVPEALVGVLFPAFATSLVQDSERAASLFTRGLKYIYLATFPVTLIVMTLAQEGLRLWLNTEFAGNSYRVLRWLMAGVFINCLAKIPFAFLQGAGRPDLTAKLHLLEIPFYFSIIWGLVHKFGIEGAAIAWTLRVAVDTVILFLMARKYLNKTLMNPRVAMAITGTIVALLVACLPLSTVTKMLFLGLSLSVFLGMIWKQLLSAEEKRLALRWL